MVFLIGASGTSLLSSDVKADVFCLSWFGLVWYCILVISAHAL